MAWSAGGRAGSPWASRTTALPDRRHRRNVASLVDAPIGEDVDIEPLTGDEARRILTAAAASRHRIPCPKKCGKHGRDAAQ